MKRKWLLIALVGGGLLLLSAAAVLLLLNVSRSGGDASIPDLSNLAPPPSLAELAEAYPEIAPLLQDTQLDAVYKEFLIAYQEGGREAAATLAQERGLLTPDGLHLRVTLVLDTEDHTALVAQLRESDIEVVSAYRDRVNVAVPVTLIEAQFLGQEHAAIFQQLTELEHVIAIRLPEVRKPQSLHPGGRILGEGVALIGAEPWHAAGYLGAGLRIGVLDLGFAGYEALLGVELPLTVTMKTFGWYEAVEVHGAACAEIVHEVAPEATLFFAWYDGTDAALGEAVEWLREQRVNIITHSVGAVVSPRDGTGWGTHLVAETAAEGILWVNSAGNEALSHHRAAFTDADGNGYHDFASGEEALAIYSLEEVEVYLVWEDDWRRPVQDLELLVLDQAGNVLASSTDTQDGTLGQRPAETVWVRTRGDTVYAVVQAYAIRQPVTFDIFVHGPGAEVARPSAQYSVSSPGDAPDALTVGATNWWDDALAAYSSRGPTTDGRLKPDITAPAGVSGFTYGTSAFDGTSASTPHVAGAAALVWSAYPQFSRQQVKDFLLANVIDYDPPGPDTGFGHGRLQLPAAPQSAIAPPTPTAPAAAPPPATESPTQRPSATAAPFATLEAPSATRSTGWGFVGWIVGGMGCSGAGLLLIAVVIVARGGRSAPSPRPAPVAPSPRPLAPPRPAPMPSSPAPSLPPTERSLSGARHPAAAKPPGSEPDAVVSCAVCGARARVGARFCAACGSPLDFKAPARFCRQCGAELRANSRFCARCGTQV